MRVNESLFCLALSVTLSLIGPVTSAQTAQPYTLQVAAFSDNESALEFVKVLERFGERPVWGSIDLKARGKWTRVFVGSFRTAAQARLYGERLVSKQVITEYLVKRAVEIRFLTRPRSVTKDIVAFRTRGERNHEQPVGLVKGVGHRAPPVVSLTMAKEWSFESYAGRTENLSRLPVSGNAISYMLPAIDTTAIPFPDPVLQAFKMLLTTGSASSAAGVRKGGLWLSGDADEGLARLRWIAGDNNAALLSVDDAGKVGMNLAALASAAGVREERFVGDPLLILDYISADEGLLLLVQVTQSALRYCLHIGALAPTPGGDVPVGGSINLDNNYDSRINPYRRQGKKLDHERPPEGFDSLVAMNPVARWFNLGTNRIVPVGHITFHELAEAHAKIELGMDYLSRASRPGAHNHAIEREKRLKFQRPDGAVVMTTGSNRVIKSERELRLVNSQFGVSP